METEPEKVSCLENCENGDDTYIAVLRVGCALRASSLKTDQYVGNRVRTRRLMLKMNQMELSRKLGLSWQTVQKYEKGEIRIGASR